MKVLKYFIASTLSIFIMSCSNPIQNNVVQKTSFSIKSISQSSEGYNEDAYLLAFPDAINGTFSTGYQHYYSLSQQDKELRMNSPEYTQALDAVNEGYNKNAYLSAFPDIVNALNNGTITSPYLHYIGSGKSEGRLTRPEYIQAYKSTNIYNEEVYLMAYPDIKIAYSNHTILNPYQHFLDTGLNEGRLTNPDYTLALQDYYAGFNEKAYLYAFPDVFNSIKQGTVFSGYIHYKVQGRSENRLNTNDYIRAKQAVDNGFDELQYLLAFDDVKHKVFLGEIESGYWHYINRASIERKSLLKDRYMFAKEGFNEEAYILTYPDIESGINSANIPSAYWHYSKHARTYENRMVGLYMRIKDAIAEGYNEKAYRMTFIDIPQAIESGTIQNGVIHYLDYGKNENRLSNDTYKLNYRAIVNKNTTGSVGDD